MLLDSNAGALTAGFDWKRFFCPRDGVISLDWNGFLLDPRKGLGEYLKTDVVPAESFESVPWVVLLGEPGMGKSFELRRHFAKADAGTVVFRDLRQYDSTEAILKEVFCSDVFVAWREGEGELTLVLDSLDEALLEIKVLAAWLIAQIEDCHSSRLRLRIACRTANWPQFVEAGLRNIFRTENVQVYELAPLSESDVLSAARSLQLDASDFFAEVLEREAGPLASKPTTLQFLLSALMRDEAFPPTQVGLYRIGCSHLCAEDEERRVSGRAGLLDQRNRLAIARRIAACTVIGNRSAIWRGPNPAEKPSAEVSIAELAGGREPVDDLDEVPVTEPNLQETLGTGLFSARGPVSLGWAHQTYAEFLAAWWIYERGLSMPQIESLVGHADDPGGRLVPQLRGTIVWLAGMHARFRTFVLDREPDLLLESDLGMAGDEERAALVHLHGQGRVRNCAQLPKGRRCGGPQRGLQVPHRGSEQPRASGTQRRRSLDVHQDLRDGGHGHRGIAYRGGGSSDRGR